MAYGGALRKTSCATEERTALVAADREQLAAPTKAISTDTLRVVSAQVERLALAQREQDRAAAGELGKRTEEKFVERRVRGEVAS
jgi:hypothetical protein